MSSLPDVATQPSLHGPETPWALAREAGVSFPTVANSTTDVDPIVQWLSLMEVVQMLCPTWPAREHGMRGNCWRL
jgi:hypothetical protein